MEITYTRVVYKSFYEKFLFADSSSQKYGERSYEDEKELNKAQLQVELIEFLHYPVYMIELEPLIKVKRGKKNEFVRPDLVVTNIKKEADIIFGIVPNNMFDASTDISIKQLYDYAEAYTTFGHCPRYLIYYTRERMEEGGSKRRCKVINYGKYHSFDKWISVGRPYSEFIPEYKLKI